MKTLRSLKLPFSRIQGWQDKKKGSVCMCLYDWKLLKVISLHPGSPTHTAGTSLAISVPALPISCEVVVIILKARFLHLCKFILVISWCLTFLSLLPVHTSWPLSKQDQHLVMLGLLCTHLPVLIKPQSLVTSPSLFSRLELEVFLTEM